MALIHLPHFPSGAGGRQEDSRQTLCFLPAPSQALLLFSLPQPSVPLLPHPQESPQTAPVLGFLCVAINQEMGLGGPWIPLALLLSS